MTFLKATMLCAALALSQTMSHAQIGTISQSGASRVLSSDGKTYIITPAMINGCTAPGGLKFDGVAGVIYCPGFYEPAVAPSASPGGGSAAAQGGQGGEGRGVSTSTETTTFDDGSTLSVTTDDSGNVVGISSTAATDAGVAPAAADADADAAPSAEAAVD
jgi:hypothetical protein